MIQDKTVEKIINTVIGLSVIAVVFVLMFVIPNYNVWLSSVHIKVAQNEGKAKLAEANQSRQIMITQSKAHAEAAIYNADAEVNRAIGAAKANKIIGNSLKNHEEYLMYLYIQNMHQSKNQIIYIPTEGGLPVLEAGRFKKGGK